MKGDSSGSFCIIIPGYQEEKRIGPVVCACLKHCPHVIVVDDGCSDDTTGAARSAGATVLRHAVNQGKGIALNTGFKHAIDAGYEFLITLDADGQHDPDEIPAFVERYRSTGAGAIIGNRMTDPRVMPFVRKLTNRFMSWLLSSKMGQRVPDTQVGYRLYRCRDIAGIPVTSPRYAAESEILLHLAARGVTIESVPIRVIYREDAESKIRPVRDTIRFFAMLRRVEAAIRDEANKGKRA